MDNNTLENLQQGNDNSNEQVRPYQEYEQKLDAQQSTIPQEPVYQQPVYQQQTFQTYQPYQPVQNPANCNGNVDEVMGTGSWFATIFVCALPCVGFIMLLVWGFGAGINKNRANYCKAMLIMKVVAYVLLIVFYAVMFALIGNQL